MFNRGSGVLLHITSLPSPYGIGDLGLGAYAFVDFLSASGQSYWQILPLNPIGYGESPYQSFSAFAINPWLLSLDKLMEKGLLGRQDLENRPSFNDRSVQYPLVMDYKYPLLRKAFNNFSSSDTDYRKFQEDNHFWLENFALFMALKEYFKGLPWSKWEKGLAKRSNKSLARYKDLLREEIDFQKFLQFETFTQWLQLKQYANSKGIEIIGDIPIFVGHDSADCWANAHLFSLDKEGTPLKVAGVPPDYFSATGQLWGSPLYKWEVMARDDYKWWRERIFIGLQLVDGIRIDHFRGFEAYWEIPALEKNAINGRWVKGPGADFFIKMEKHLGKLPIIAEDLGIITPEVEELKLQFGYPGMKILQFFLEDFSRKVCLPLDWETNSVAYTGTHDNDTMLGWYSGLKERKCLWLDRCNSLNIKPTLSKEEVCWRFIELVHSSPSIIAIIPLQDILGLDSWARINFPGTIGGNWIWRFQKEGLTGEIANRLMKITKVNNR